MPYLWYLHKDKLANPTCFSLLTPSNKILCIDFFWNNAWQFHFWGTDNFQMKMYFTAEVHRSSQQVKCNLKYTICKVAFFIWVNENATGTLNSSLWGSASEVKLTSSFCVKEQCSAELQNSLVKHKRTVKSAVLIKASTCLGFTKNNWWQLGFKQFLI